MGRRGVFVADLLSDLFARLRNGQAARRVSVTAPYSGLSAAVVGVLAGQGFVRGARALELRAGVRELEVFLKYDEEGVGAIRKLRRVSKPSRRVSARLRDLPRASRGLGCWILSTSRGVMHCARARELGVGGEILGEVL